MELDCNYSSKGNHSEASNGFSSDERNDLSDENEEIMDNGGAIVSETPKSFLAELKLQKYFTSSAKQPSVEERVNQAINSILSKIMPPKGHMSVWTDAESKNDQIRRKLAQQRRRDQAKRDLQDKTRASCRKFIEKSCRSLTERVDVEEVIEGAVNKVVGSKKQIKYRQQKTLLRSLRLTGHLQN